MSTLLIGFERGGIADGEVKQIKMAAPDMTVVVANDPHEIEGIAEDVEIAAGWLSPQIVLNLPNVRWYQQWAAGVDWILRHPEARDKDFVVTNGSGIHAICISEQIFSYLLAFARGLPAARTAQNKGEWVAASGENLFELAYQKLVMIGLGDIGARTVQVARAFEMEVVGVDRNPLLYLPGLEQIVHPDKMLDVLPDADFVVVALPHTRDTEGMINKEVFDSMKDGVYFINIGRGPTVKEDALIEALQSGKIAGAGLDVFEVEPLPTGSPLWAMENVIITAHYAGATPRYQQRAMTIFLENLRRYQNGEALHNAVNKELGY